MFVRTLILVVLTIAVTLIGCTDTITIAPQPGYSIPQDFEASFGGSQVILTWGISEIGTETGYEIYRLSDGGFIKIGSTSKNEYTFGDSDVLPNTIYHYKVRGIFDGFIGEFTYAEDITTELQTPINLALAFDGSSLNISWEMDEGIEINGFEIWRSVKNASNYALLGESSADELSYADSDLTLGNTYYYKIRTMYGIGVSEFCEEQSITIREYTYGGSWTIDEFSGGFYAIAATPNGDIYVTDAHKNLVYYFDITGGYLGEWTHTGLYSRGIAISPDVDTIYVAYPEYSRVGMFSRTGTFKGFVGTGNPGSGDGDFDYPFEIAVAPNGNIYVVDGLNCRIQYFTSDGQYLGQWGEEGTLNGQFTAPSGIDIASNGDIYVCEFVGSRVQYFTSTGDFLDGWGSEGWGDGEFLNPTSVAISPLNGDIFVAEWDRVQCFSVDGTYRYAIARYDEYGGFGGTAGVCFSPSDDKVLITDEITGRVTFFVKFKG